MTNSKCIECGNIRHDGFTSSEGFVCTDCVAYATSPSLKAAKKGEQKGKDRSKAFLGMATEKRLEAILPGMAERGCYLFKVPTPTHYQSRSTVDFVGVDGTGAALAIEVKSTKHNRFFVRTVRPNQKQYLDTVDATTHGLAFLLVDFVELGRWFLVPWWAAKEMKTITPSAAAEYEREYFAIWEPVGSPSEVGI